MTSAYYIRAAKILRLAAKELGFKKDVKEYEHIIKQLSESLQAHSWDEETGYFGYVMHDNNGKPKGIYRYKDGSNFNKRTRRSKPAYRKYLLPRANRQNDKPYIFSE